MQAQRSSDAVDQLGLGHSLRDDVADVELEEVDGACGVSVVGRDAADFDEDGAEEGDEKDEGGLSGFR